MIPQTIAPKLDAEELMLDIGGESDALRRVVAEYRRGGSAREALERIPRRPRSLWIGMGSSWAACEDAANLLGAHGADAHAELASTGAPRLATSETVAILVSASGETPETYEAATRHHGRSVTVAVTAAGRPLAEAVDHHLVLPYGSLLTATAFRVFQATVAVLELLAAHVRGQDPDGVIATIESAAAGLEELIDGSERWLGAMADLLARSPIFIAAPAQRMAGARQGALMLREAPRLVAHACEIGNWSHADVYLSARPGYALIMLGDSGWAAELTDWMSSRNATLITLGETESAGAALHVATRPGLSHLLETTVIELLACELLRRLQDVDVEPSKRELAA